MDPLVERVAAYVERHALLTPDSGVVVGVSGGPDSLCLLHVLLALAPARGLRLRVAHLDHMLRMGSDEDAAYVARLAAAWGVPAVFERADVAAHARSSGQGIEAAARELRHRFLLRAANEAGAQAIALGHTADDQAETVLLRLLRGAGPQGLAAMRPRRPAHPEHARVMLVRPLLDTRRAEVERYCEAHAISPLRDPSNEQPIYARNRVRGYILPLLKTYNPSIVATLARTARICAEESELVDEFVDRAWRDVARREGAEIALDRPGFAALHPALRRRVLRRAAAEVGPDVELTARHIDLALDAIEARRRRMQLPGGVWIRIGREALVIGRRTVPDREKEEQGEAASRERNP